jgi:general secretion pathway protein E
MFSEQLFHILNAKYGLSEEVFEESRRIKNEKGGSIGDILVGRNIITESELLEAFSIQYDMPFWPDLPLDAVDSRILTRRFPKKQNM